MQRHIRKTAWLWLATLLALSLGVAAVAAHEGRPAGDYRLIVGWLTEPTYEGANNAVSIRVNKIVEGESATGDHDHDDSDHDHDPTATPEAHDHDDGDHDHDPTATPEAHDHDDGDHDHDPTATPEAHDHDHDDTVEAGSAMSVEVEASLDQVSGVNVHIKTTGFTFSAEAVNQEDVDGEGHAHIYVDGVKVSRVYTPWVHLEGLAPGTREIEVTLNANSHPEYSWDGAQVRAATTLTVPEEWEAAHHHGGETVEAAAEMSFSIRLESDPLGGANLFITELEGFTFAPGNAGLDHVAGEGHARVYVNEVQVARLHGNALQLGAMAEGRNKVRVALHANDHAAYTWNGAAVDAAADITIEPGMGGAGYGDGASASHKGGDKTEATVEDIEEGHAHYGNTQTGNGMEEEDSSRSAARMAAGKPQASMAGQDEGVAVPVEGLEGTLQVEVTHVSSGASRVFDLKAVWGDPGHYIAELVPTSSGVYEFRFFGTIEGMSVDESFASHSGGGDFDDVQTSADLQFPEQLPEMREIVGAVQGARNMAQQAQDAALAAQADGTGGGGNALAIVALVVGIVGAALGPAAYSSPCGAAPPGAKGDPCPACPGLTHPAR